MTPPDDAVGRPQRTTPMDGDRTPASRDAAAFVAASAGTGDGAVVGGGGLHRLLVESVRDYAIFALDPDGRVVSWNAGAEHLKGYTAEEIVGRHFSTFYPPERVAEGFPAYELEVARREGRFEDEGWRVRKDGTRFWANVVITALRDDGGALVGFAKITRDLTARRAAEEAARRLAAEEAAHAEALLRQAELELLAAQLQDQAVELEAQTEEAQSLAEELEMANEELQRALADAEQAAHEAAQANRVKAEFLRAMSHELRTPINATLGYAELLAIGIRGPITEAQRDDLERIRRSQQHLLGIVNDLLNYSRIDAGHMEYDQAPVPVHAVVAAVVPMVEPQALAKGLAVEHGPCSEELVAQADRVKAMQIVLNLLSNAVKFTPPGGRITISCGEADGWIVVTVTDTGPGVPPEQHERIFEPFVQLGRSHTSGHEGTGLGLAISRDLARAMGGDIMVASVPERGAAFTFALPPVSPPG